MSGVAFGWAAPAAGCSVLALVAASFAVGARTGKHSVMDIAWGASIATAAVASFMTSSGHGSPARRWLLPAAAFTWGCRLAWHVAARSRGAGEDPRYRELLDRAPGSGNWYALRVVYLLQLLILWLACLPLPAGMTQQAAPGAVTAVGGVVWLTDQRMSRSRPGCASYAARTSGFIPLPPRRARQAP